MLYAKLLGKKIFGYVDNPAEQDKKYGERGYIRYKETILEPFIIYWVWNDLGDCPKDVNKGEWFSETEVPRDDKNLVRVVKTLGDAANGRFAKLKIVIIPANVSFTIEEYDGSEHIAEKHKTWG